MCHARLIGALSAGLGVQALASAMSITPLSVLNTQTGSPYGMATAISADGSAIVGGSRNAKGVLEPVRWSTDGNVVPLGNPSGIASYATGVAVKPGGEIVVAGNVGAIARRWSSTTGTWDALPPTSLCTTSTANSLALTADGADAWIAGWSDVRGGCGGHLFNGGYRYAWNTHSYSVTYYQSSNQCDFWGVAADGTAVGRQVITGLGDRAVYWDGTGGSATFIAPLIDSFAQARAISNDAGTIVGFAMQGSLSRAFLYQAGASTVVDLGTLPGDEQSVASAVSGNGSVAGGFSVLSSRPAMSTMLATIWDARGTHDLRDLLAAGGADLAGWRALNNVISISADGKSLCGNGWYDPDGVGPAAAVQMGFVAVIPEPASGVLLGVLAGVLPLLRRRAPAAKRPRQPA